MSLRIPSFMLAASLALTGCTALHLGSHPAPPLSVVLFDVSQSTRDPSVRARYLSAFERVLDYVVAERGTLVVDVIDDNPLAHSSFPIDATFTACDPLTDNPLECDARTSRLRDDVAAEAKRILSTVSVAAGTDIHDGLLLAARVFDAYREAGARSLVLLSDMVERSPRLNVARASSGDGLIGSTLDGFASDGLLPDLEGVSVYVVGAGVVSDAEMPADRSLAIESFWRAYFARAGADLPTDRYGAALVRFP